MDTLFNDILTKLQEIHNNFPDLRFGQVLQLSLDTKKGKNNSDLNEQSSKQILSALNEYAETEKKKRGN